MSSKNVYRLINPYIEGSINTIVQASNSFSAGKKLYNTVSRYFTNHVSNFYMTIQNIETNELSHFKIDEKMGGSGNVDYNLVKLEDNFSPDIDKKLVSMVGKFEKQTGGGLLDDIEDDDSPSESPSDNNYFLKIPVQPITRFVYFYLPYYKLNVVNLVPIDQRRLFMPMFGLPINPTLEIRFDVYKI